MGGQVRDRSLCWLPATRVAIKTTTGIIKIAGATFVASEVLNRAGVFNTVDLPDISEENMALLKKARRVAASSLNNFRMEVRQRLSPEKANRYLTLHSRRKGWELLALHLVRSQGL